MADPRSGQRTLRRRDLVADSSQVSEPSYRALLEVPALGRILLGSTIARTAGGMVGVTLVLFSLQRYGSPAIAGLVTLASILPALLASPIAGALLDRHGRARLIVLDYLVAAGSLVLIAALAAIDSLPAWLLIVIAAVASLTNIFSHTGLRSLFPLLVPERLWERVNAVDSNGYIVATLVGPASAGILVQFVGGSTTLALIGAIFAVAAVTLLRIPDPDVEGASTGRLLVDAWQGMRYVWRNPTLRALGLSLSVANLAFGTLTLLVPVLLITRHGSSPVVVGLAFAAQGAAGMISAAIAGRWDTRGRERGLIARPLALSAAIVALLLLPIGAPGIFVVMALLGLTAGPLDIAMFTLRQRRTDRAIMGRAFAVSMAFNFFGVPLGSAIGGVLADTSPEAAVAFAVVAALAGAALAARLLPDADETVGSTGDAAEAAEAEPAAADAAGADAAEARPDRPPARPMSLPAFRSEVRQRDL